MKDNDLHSVRIDEKSWEKLKIIGRKQKPPLGPGKMIIKMIWDWVKK